MLIIPTATIMHCCGSHFALVPVALNSLLQRQPACCQSTAQCCHDSKHSCLVSRAGGCTAASHPLCIHKLVADEEVLLVCLLALPAAVHCTVAVGAQHHLQGTSAGTNTHTYTSAKNPLCSVKLISHMEP